VARFVDVGQEAHGFIAIGQFATGVIAFGQVATGVIAIGQVARGFIAIGMAAFGVITLGMAALGLCWTGGMVVAGGRVGPRLIGIPLVPYWPAKPARPTPIWAGLGAAQLAVLVVASILFWVHVAVPLGDALFGPAGITRTLTMK
jgi:hypothetical protein